MQVIPDAVQTAVDSSPMDIENTVGKIYQHFSTFTVHVQTIKDIYEPVDMGYKNILGHNKPLSLYTYDACC
jgi:hypothetical protein